ncbi:MAG: DeoR/GlpR family DNA-binding transcription regulator [Collinsella sp.]|nr:DeoR/GlpR family DNA-binding transcription regulator [Collinsella sp.]
MTQSGSKAFAEERRAAIMRTLERDASVQVSDLARTFGVSAVTIRGDLDALEADGKLRRTHGGAVSLHKALTVSVQDRRVNINAKAKQLIAKRALEFVRDGDTILVDSGTTALEFVRTLDARSGITVVTADITIADYIDDSMPTVDVILLGGALRKGHRYLHGMLALRSLEVLHTDLAVVCPGSFVPSRGFMTDYPQMAQLKRAYFEASERTVALLDASKLDGGGLMRFAGLEDVGAIIMDEDPEGVVALAIAELPEGARVPKLVLA